MTRGSRTALRALATAALVCAVATPALPVDLSNTVWLTSGTSVAKVKGLAGGRAKGTADLSFNFGGDGSVTVVDDHEHRFTGTWTPEGRKGTRATLAIDGASTTLLESVLEDDIARAVAEKGGGSVVVSADVTSVTARSTFNRKGTKMRFRLKVKAIGSADVDPRRRHASYLIRTKGVPAF